MSKKRRPIDKAAKNGTLWLYKKAALMNKKKVTTLKGLVAITFVLGAFTMLIWSVKFDVQIRSEAKSKSDSSSELKIKTLNNGSKIVEGELLVKFKDNVSKDKKESILKEHGAKEKEEIPKIKVKRISVPEAAREKVMEALSKNKDVEFVENNGVMEPSLVPNDPSFGTQWHLKNIQVPEAWDVSKGSSSVLITICDSGVYPTHQDLAAKLVSGYNFYNNNSDFSDVYGHGTAVAGAATALTDNSLGIAGAAWESKIIPVRVTGTDGWATWSALSRCIIYGTDNGSRISNASFGSSTPSSALTSAANYAWSKNGMVFASAGNSGASTPFYPANTEHVIAVGATSSSNNKSSYSNYGDWVDIGAPGDNIYTTNRGGGYGAWNGTSFASPIAAGVAALIMGANPSLSNVDVEAILKETADPMPSTLATQNLGAGKINAYKAVQAALTYVPKPDTSNPTISISSPANGSNVSSTISISASANDDRGVTKVEFYRDGSLISSDTASPYSTSWDTTKQTNGSYTLQAKAYDAAGNIGTSSSISVNVNNTVAPPPPTDATAPTVSLTAPTEGTVTTSTLTITANASDNVGVSNISIILDGKSVKTCRSTTTCSYKTSTKLAKGSHAASAKANDAAGNTTTSTAVNFTRQ